MMDAMGRADEDGPVERVASFRPGDREWPQLLAALGLASDGGGAAAAGAETVVEEIVAAVRAFVDAVDWTEPWIIALLSFHAATTVVLVATRKHHNFQMALFMGLLLLAWSGELLNTLAREHWASFSRTNYFDQSGFFVTVVFGVPLVLNSILGLVFMLLRAVDLMVIVKRRQLREQIRQKRAADGGPKKTN